MNSGQTAVWTDAHTQQFLVFVGKLTFADKVTGIGERFILTPLPAKSLILRDERKPKLSDERDTRGSL